MAAKKKTAQKSKPREFKKKSSAQRPKQPRPKVRHRTTTIELDVVGMQHRITQSTRNMISAKIKEIGPLASRLVREADNFNDENAIMVVISEKPYAHLHIGYLRRQVAQEYAPVMDNDEITIVSADLFAVDPLSGEGEILVKFKRPLKTSRKSGT